MNEWIIKFTDAQALDRIKEIGIHLHTAKLDSIVVMKSDYRRDQIASIPGVLECKEVDVFALQSVGGAIIWQ